MHEIVTSRQGPVATMDRRGTTLRVYPPENASEAKRQADLAAQYAAAAQAGVDNFAATFAEGIANFAVDEYFACPESGTTRIYKRIVGSPYYSDVGDAAAPITKALLAASTAAAGIGTDGYGTLQDALDDRPTSTALADDTGADLIGTPDGTVQDVLDNHMAFASLAQPQEMWRKLDAGASVVTVNMTTTSGSTTATVASATGLVDGMTVTGANISPGTTITISGTTVTLSIAATASGTASHVFSWKVDVSLFWLGDSRGDSTSETAYLWFAYVASLYPSHTFKYRFGTNTSGVFSWDSYSTLQTGTGTSVVYVDLASISGSGFNYYKGANRDVVYGNSHGAITVTATTTSGSQSVVVNNLSGITRGMKIAGTGIPTFTDVIVTSITTATKTLTISQKASASGSVSLTLTRNPEYDFAVVAHGPNFGSTVTEEDLVNIWREGLLELRRNCPKAGIVATYGMPWVGQTEFTYRNDRALRVAAREVGVGYLNIIDPAFALPSVTLDSYYQSDANDRLHPNSTGSSFALGVIQKAFKRRVALTGDGLQDRGFAVQNFCPNPYGHDWDERNSKPRGSVLTYCTTSRETGIRLFGPYSIKITATAGGESTYEIPLPVSNLRGREVKVVAWVHVPTASDARCGRIQLVDDAGNFKTSPSAGGSTTAKDGIRPAVVSMYVRPDANSLTLKLYNSDSGSTGGGSITYLCGWGAYVDGLPLQPAPVPNDVFVPDYYSTLNVRNSFGNPDETLTVTGKQVAVSGATSGLARASIDLHGLKIGKSYRVTWTLNSGNGTGVVYLRDALAGAGSNVANANFSTGALLFTATAESMSLLAASAAGETAWDITFGDIRPLPDAVVFGRYQLPDNIPSTTASGGTAPGSNTLKAIRWYNPEYRHLSGMGQRFITTAASGNCEWAVYAEDAESGDPTGDPIFESGNISTASSTGTSSSTTPSTGVWLEPGWYWLMLNFDTNGATAVPIYCNVGAWQGPRSGGSSASNAYSITGQTKGSVTYGTWPTLTGSLSTDGFTDNTASNVGVPVFLFD